MAADDSPQPTAGRFDPTDRSEAKVCWRLRAKTGYGTTEGGPAGWPLVDTSTMVFRCKATLQPWGPDGGLASFPGCRVGRACFVVPLEEDL